MVVTCEGSIANCELLRHVYAKLNHSLFTFTYVGEKNESFTTMSLVRESIHKRMWKGRSGEEIIALFVPTKEIRQCKYFVKNREPGCILMFRQTFASFVTMINLLGS